MRCATPGRDKWSFAGWLPALAALAISGCGKPAADRPSAPAQPDAAAPLDAAQAGAAAGNAGAGSGASAGSAGAAGSAGSMSMNLGRPVPPEACRPDGPTPDQLGSARTVLYSGPRALTALAERRGQLFAIDPADGILRLDAGETALERAVAGTVGELLVADLNLYWTRDGGLWRAAINGTDETPDPVAMQLGHQASLLRFDADHLYFADSAAHGVFRIPIAGGAVESLASGVDVRDQAVQSGFVYFADATSKRVQRVAVEGGAAAPLSPIALSEPRALATDGSTLYWADGFELVATALDDPSARKSLATAGPRADGQPARIVRIELAGERLYFSDDAGNVGWTALDGSKCGLAVKSAGTLIGSDVDGDGEYAYLLVSTASAHELWKLALN